MTIAPKKKPSPKGERSTSRQSGPASPEHPGEQDSTHPSGHKIRTSKSEHAAAAALALRNKLARHGGCRLVHETPMQHKKAHPPPPPPPKEEEVEEEPEPTGYNSDDEYYGPAFKDDALEKVFEERMKRERGLDIVEMGGDGNCMFRAVAHQMYGDQDMHGEVRKLCMDYMDKNRSEFMSFLTEDIDSYIERKSRPDVHGNHLELQVLTEIFARPIEIYEYDTKPMKSFTPPNHRQVTNGNAPIRLSYHGRVHYNAVIDPYTATIGVGLGLPGMNPGEADRNLLDEVMRESESQQIEEAMLKDKLKMTDWENTDQEINQAVMRESVQQYINECETRAKKETTPKDGESEKSDSKNPELIPSTDVQGPSSSGRPTPPHGVKRGASSPNLPGCSRDDVWGMSKSLGETSSSSLPNIDICQPGPSTSRAIQDEPKPGSSKCDSSNVGTGLYEELLRTHNFEKDVLAEVLAASTKEYLEFIQKTGDDES
ncbi:hypothetical protein L596_005626 [Steinernema carpocapsae]|uniref:ubiquitinyl hydrolase 1 n=1 Tax=Steinernema carpocapsae TaxID=34508 RepID=A0A4U8UZV7_STECR|nr:hypothetical protein L596_005626 [Steinernema carpocapsae]